MASSNFFVGSMLTALFVVIQCGASVYAELWLKQDRHIPYFIQKFYLETSGLAFALFITLFLDGWMVRAGLSAERGGLADAPYYSLSAWIKRVFAGWQSPW